METFNFYKDEKCTIWTRLKFSIKAKTYEEAVAKVLEIEEHCNYDEVQTDHEFLYDTTTELTPDLNEEKSTIEIYSSDTDKLIFENGPSII
jgi:hypothetical protein